MKQREFGWESDSHFLFALITFIFLQGCNSGGKVNQQAVKDEMASREIKKVSTLQILEKARDIGNMVADEAQRELQENLLEALDEGEVPNALKFCSENAMNIVSEVEETYHAEVGRRSLKYRNPENKPDSIEQMLLEAYQYSLDNQLPLEPAVEEISESEVLYSKPILLGSPLCLNCHGTIEKNIASENVNVLNDLYPDDLATGYQLGQLRGIWSIRIPKKEIIKSL